MGVNYSGSYATPRLDLAQAFMEHAAELTDFVGNQILPVFRTPKKAATFSAITRETLLQDKDALRAARAGYSRIHTGAEDKSYECLEYGLEHVVDDSERSLYQSDFDADNAATKILARAVMLQYEKRVAAAIFNTTTWTGSALYTDNSSAPWDAAGSDVIAHVLAAKEKVRSLTGMEPNALILSQVQLNNLLGNTGIKARFPSVPVLTAQMIRDNIAAIFDLRRLIVGKAVRNSAIEGQAYSGADVWSDDYAMVALIGEPGDGLAVPQLGRTMLWVPDSPSEIMIEQYREEQVRGDVFRARHSTDELIIDPCYAHLMRVDV